MYIHSTGGIGNQLFQYNLAHLLSTKTSKKTIILFDNSSTAQYPRKNFLSEILLNCEHGVSIIEDSKLLLAIRARDSFRYRVGIKPNTNKEKTFVGYLKSEIKELNDMTAPILFSELWQDWQLVNQGFPIIKRELSIWLNSAKFDDRILRILSREFQTIHIRRGDYSLNPDAWGLLSIEYYKINVPDDLFTIILTDDDFAISKLRMDFPKAEVFGPKELNELQTLKLMSLSKRIFIANSSFSWWGSLFARELSGANVIMPDIWFKESEKEPNLLGDPQNEYRKAIFE